MTDKIDIDAHINVLRTAVAQNLAQCTDTVRARQILELAMRHLERAEELSAPHLVEDKSEEVA